MLADKTYFDLVIYNHANFYRFEESSKYWSVKRISGFLCFSLVYQRHTSGITVYNRRVTNIRKHCAGRANELNTCTITFFSRHRLLESSQRTTEGTKAAIAYLLK